MILYKFTPMREGSQGRSAPHVVMVHIYNLLRKKIEKNPSEPQFIQAIRGGGYKFNDKPHHESGGTGP